MDGAVNDQDAAATHVRAAVVRAGGGRQLRHGGDAATQAAGPAYLVKDIQPPDASLRPHALTDVNGILFFVADDGVHGYELWKSDGTPAGTMPVKNIRGRSASSELGNPRAIDGVVSLSATDGTTGRELWRSDGTTAGTL